MTLPKVLIIGQPFNKQSGGAITQTNLFSNWDKDKLAVISIGHLLTNLNLEICDNYYQLGSNAYKWIFPFNLLQRKLKSGQLDFNPNRIQEHTLRSPKKGLRNEIIKKYLQPFLKHTGLLYFISRIQITNQLLSWIENYNPDVIYAQASSRELILFCINLQKKVNKPLIFHMMDDWPSTICDKGIFKFYWQKKIDKEFRTLLNTSTILLSISDKMSKEYLRRYNKTFLPFHNPINLDVWKKYQKSNYQLSESLTILYAGRTGPGIQKSLKEIARAVETVNNELSIKLKFIIKTDVEPIWVKDFSCVEIQEMVPHNKMPEILAKADFLILPFDFSEESIRFTKYSMPTKATEFMISGTPIIIFAPEETALVDYAKKYKIAKIITENDYNKLAKEIKYLISNKEERMEIGENAKKIASQNHNSKTITNSFQEIIKSIDVVL